MLINTLQCTGQSPHQGIVWPKMSIVPGLRNPAVGKGTHFILWDVLALGPCGHGKLDKKTHSLELPPLVLPHRETGRKSLHPSLRQLCKHLANPSNSANKDPLQSEYCGAKVRAEGPASGAKVLREQAKTPAQSGRD